MRRDNHPRDRKRKNRRGAGLEWRVLHRIIILLFILPWFGCAGSSVKMPLAGVRYPVSLSGYLFGPRKEILGKGQRLQVVREFNYTKSFWGIGYTLISLSDETDFDRFLNRKIEEAEGDGVINLKLSSSGCYINSTPCLNILPMWPGCTRVKIQGEIVRLRRMDGTHPKRVTTAEDNKTIGKVLP